MQRIQTKMNESAENQDITGIKSVKNMKEG